MEWNLTLGTSLPIADEDTVDRIMEDLARFSVAVTTAEHDRDHAAATITVPAADLADAIEAGLVAARAAGLGQITWLEVMPTAAFDQAHEAGGPALPELVGLAAAAAELGVSRNTVQRWIGTHLVGTKVDGPGWVVTRSSLDRLLASRRAQAAS